ncbi:MAG TPA: ABC transporter permease [Bryobacteraceae bacterium]|nr:ABC transporter permease [Bryobacteraceae bacterium]
MRREYSLLIALGCLLLFLALASPGFFSAANLRDLALSNIPVLVAAIGMTIVILLGQIDVSIGSQFAACTVAAGLLAKAGLPMPILLLAIAAAGMALGAFNGALVAWLGIPSIVVTLATMVILRDTLRWITGGEWVQNLPGNFQWMGLGQAAGQALIAIVAGALFLLCTWAMRHVAAGRAVYATGSNAESARLAGIQPRRIVFGAFACMGAFTGIAALLNSIRFTDLQSNSGVGLELKTIAAVVVGGVAINGGRGTMAGALLGVALLGTIGPALTFLGISAFWEKAIQGAIILAAVAIDRIKGKK